MMIRESLFQGFIEEIYRKIFPVKNILFCQDDNFNMKYHYFSLGWENYVINGNKPLGEHKIHGIFKKDRISEFKELKRLLRTFFN